MPGWEEEQLQKPRIFDSSLQARRAIATDYDQLTRGVSLLLSFLLPVKSLSPLGSSSLNLGVLCGLGLVALGITQLPSDSWSRKIVAIMVIALITSPILTSISLSSGTRSPEPINRVGVTLLLVEGIVGVIALCWCAKITTPRAMLAAFSSGLVVQALLIGGIGGLLWKGMLGWSITVLIFLALSRIESLTVSVIVMTSLGAVSFALDSRALGMFCGVAVVIFVWSKLVKAQVAPSSRIVSFGMVASIALIGLLFGPAVASEGALGDSVRERTVSQIGDSGTFGLLSSARPESSGAWNLVKANPIGFGPGVSLTPAEKASTKRAMAQVDPNLDVEGGYVDRYVLNTRVRLHSVTADLWFNFGLFGFAAAAFFFWYLIRAAFRFMYFGFGGPAAFFLISAGLWDLAFSPLDSNFLLVVAAVVYVVMSCDLEGHSRAHT